MQRFVAILVLVLAMAACAVAQPSQPRAYIRFVQYGIKDSAGVEFVIQNGPNPLGRNVLSKQTFGLITVLYPITGGLQTNVSASFGSTILGNITLNPVNDTFYTCVVWPTGDYTGANFTCPASLTGLRSVNVATTTGSIINASPGYPDNRPTYDIYMLFENCPLTTTDIAPGEGVLVPFFPSGLNKTITFFDTFNRIYYTDVQNVTDQAFYTIVITEVAGNFTLSTLDIPGIAPNTRNTCENSATQTSFPTTDTPSQTATSQGGATSQGSSGTQNATSTQSSSAATQTSSSQTSNTQSSSSSSSTPTQSSSNSPTSNTQSSSSPTQSSSSQSSSNTQSSSNSPTQSTINTTGNNTQASSSATTTRGSSAMTAVASAVAVLAIIVLAF